MLKQLRSLSIPPDWRDLAKLAIEQGWVLAKTKSGHIKWCPPQGSGGRAVFTSGSPSDHRALLNTRTKLRREGLRL